MKMSAGLLAALAAACSAWAGAQTPAADPPATGPTAAVFAEPGSGECCRIAAGTAVELEIVDPLSSGHHQRGHRFAIRLHAPLRDGDVVVVPAGTPGVGEIVHADRSRGGGKPGELLLAARHLEFNGVQIPLRGLKLGGQGLDRTRTALGVAVAAGPFAHFIRGREIEIPAYTLVNAKLAQELALPAAAIDTSIPDTAAGSSNGAANEMPGTPSSAAPKPSAPPTTQE